jgi:DNA-binding NarL/FixJ family response regulator
MRLWLVDDNSAFRDLLAALLTADGDIECTGQFCSPETVLNALGNELPPEAILLDVQMGRQNGIDAIRPIKALAGSVHVFILTTFYDHDRKVRALENGASGFLLKTYPATEIQRQLRAARDHPAPTGIVSASMRMPRETPLIPTAASSRHWPKRCANGRADEESTILLQTEHTRRGALRRHASSGLLRSVTYLRTWLGLF